MKIVRHDYSDKWFHVERIYLTRSKIECHIVDFCKQQLEKMTDKSLDKIEPMINNELKKYLAFATKGKRPVVEVIRHKAGTVRNANGGQTFYAISIVFNNKAASFCIQEPMP